MRNRLLGMGITAVVVMAGCTTSVTGRAAPVPMWTGPTIAPPGADGPATRTAEAGEPADPTPEPTEPTPEPQPEPAEPTPEPVPAVPPVPDVLLQPIDLAPGPDGYLVFQTPSGNIFCGLALFEGVSASRCDLLETTYPEPPAVDCETGDFSAATASLIGDDAGVVGGCLSDTVIDPSALPLPYGANAGAGDIVCHSAEDGVTCGNLITGHGFSVSRGAYRVF